MKTICMYCGKLLSDDGNEDTREQVSHGLCNLCYIKTSVEWGVFDIRELARACRRDEAKNLNKLSDFLAQQLKIVCVA